MSNESHCVLGVETSCDETGVAIYHSDFGILAHNLYSQVAMHAQHGGVVPELASRDHIRKTLPLIQATMADANLTHEQLTGIAYTAGPGLIGALMVGASVARSLAYAWNLPAVAVHHMEAHLLAPLLENPSPSFPFLALLVSGGHTQLVRVDAIGQYTILGESVDDAAGEAFDKVARLLELGHPGGPLVAKLANEGDASRFPFTKPMVQQRGLDFSFSGLKTQVMTQVKRLQANSAWDQKARADVAASFQKTVVDTLAIKCKRALEQTGLNKLVVAGGVSANTLLRSQLQILALGLNATVYFPRLEYCTDNGAMVAFAGYQHLRLGEEDDLTIQARARWPISAISH